jgi:hypothetical protein
VIPQTVVFRFDDKDMESINDLKAQGFEFVTITMRDKRGYERAFTVWVPPSQSDRDSSGRGVEDGT